jgi:hypothetical protein
MNILEQIDARLIDLEIERLISEDTGDKFKDYTLRVLDLLLGRLQHLDMSHASLLSSLTLAISLAKASPVFSTAAGAVAVGHVVGKIAKWYLKLRGKHHHQIDDVYHELEQDVAELNRKLKEGDDLIRSGLGDSE